MKKDRKAHRFSLKDVERQMQIIEDDDNIIAELSRKRADDVRKAKIKAANVFTPEFISEIVLQSSDLLKCNDMDENKLIDIFSDISKLAEGDIAFLIERAKLIEQIESETNDNSVITRFAPAADLLLGKGGADND